MPWARAPSGGVTPGPTARTLISKWLIYIGCRRVGKRENARECVCMMGKRDCVEERRGSSMWRGKYGRITRRSRVPLSRADIE